MIFYNTNSLDEDTSVVDQGFKTDETQYSPN